ncbi:hypothetical protein KEM56_007367 [Ascosphaera pollenicola]|nr:hypothetical protein KEM56_007367 [Ascosphaera pollenicola]
MPGSILEEDASNDQDDFIQDIDQIQAHGIGAADITKLKANGFYTVSRGQGYFVEQYYTTLSREPEKLHLYYNKDSQFCFGNEAEKVTVAVGPSEIQSRIRSLDFRSCKVRVLNVDAQGSFDNILVIVIGEISTNGQPCRKFVQTFVLAQQPNGYYVLNDVFRYLQDEEEEEVDAAAVPAAAPEQQNEAIAAEQPVEEQQQPAPVAAEHAPVAPVEKKEEEVEEKKEEEEEVEQKAPEPQAETLTTAGATEAVDEKLAEEEKQEDKAVAEEEKHKEEEVVAPAAAVEEKIEESEEKLVEAENKEEPKEQQTEQPSSGLKEPAHTPAAADAATTKPAPASAQPAKQQEKLAAPVPKAPMSWANIASKNKAASAAVPAVPIVPVKAPTAPAAERKEEPAAAAAAPSPAPAPAKKEEKKEKPTTNGTVKPATPISAAAAASSEWQTVSGNEHHVRRTSARGGGAGGFGRGGAAPSDGASAAGPHNAGDNENNTYAYIKNVHDKVDAALLKATLSKFGPIKDFDVSRTKNCAFVEFGTPAAYRAAVAANPHTIGTEQITVESRRFRNPPGNAPNGRPRGDRNSGGRGGMKGYPRGGRSGQGPKRGSA